MIPATERAAMIRTDFSDYEEWASLCAKLRAPMTIQGYEISADVEVVDNPIFDGKTKEQLIELIPADYGPSFFIVVDKQALSHPDSPVLLVDLFESPGQELRVSMSALPSIEANLTYANMDFEEFVENADPDGIFRDFR